MKEEEGCERVADRKHFEDYKRKKRDETEMNSMNSTDK